MERKQEEKGRKMKELQSPVECLQRENDQLRTHMEKVANLEEVLSIKLSLKHSLSIFVIAHFQSLDKVDILLSFKKKAQTWLLSCWHF